MYDGALRRHDACYLPVQSREDGVGDGVVAGRHVVDPFGRRCLEDVEGPCHAGVGRHRRAADGRINARSTNIKRSRTSYGNFERLQ